MSQYDAFGDVINESNGIFSAEASNIAGRNGGLTAHDQAKTVPMQQGVMVIMNCRGCPRPLQITIEYPELVAIKYGVSPHEAFARHPHIVQELTEWRYNPDQGWWPVRVCPGCRNIAGPMFTFEEAEALLSNARRRNWIHTAGEQGVAAIAHQVANSKRQAQVQQLGR